MSQETETPIGYGQDTLGREKDWEELDTSGQMERMRGMVKQLIHDNRRLDRTVRQLREHQHAHDGNVLIAINRRDKDVGHGGSRGDAWF